MPKAVIFSIEAVNDLDKILQQIGEFTGSSASVTKFRNGFKQKFHQIAQYPKAARLLDDGTRQSFFQRYRIIY